MRAPDTASENTQDLPSDLFYILFTGSFSSLLHGIAGSKQFIKDRLVRLGIPLIIFASFIDPPIEYMLALWRGWLHGSFLAFLSNPNFYTPTGPLWFVLALLVFAIAYIGCRALSSKATKSYPFPKNRLSLASRCCWVSHFCCEIRFPVGWTFRGLTFS